MKPTLGEAIKTVLGIQLAVILFTSLAAGFYFTRPLAYAGSFENVPFEINLTVGFILLLSSSVSPLLEELIFRGPFLRAAGKWESFQQYISKSRLNFWLVIAVGGLYFGFAHILYPLPWRLATSVLGMTFTWLVIEYKKLWPVILLHYFWNILFVIVEVLFSPYFHKELPPLFKIVLKG